MCSENHYDYGYKPSPQAMVYICLDPYIGGTMRCMGMIAPPLVVDAPLQGVRPYVYIYGCLIEVERCGVSLGDLVYRLKLLMCYLTYVIPKPRWAEVWHSLEG